MKELDPNKLRQIGMNGPNVNLKFLKFIQQNRKEKQNHLIDIWSCMDFIQCITHLQQELKKLIGE